MVPPTPPSECTSAGRQVGLPPAAAALELQTLQQALGCVLQEAWQGVRAGAEAEGQRVRQQGGTCGSNSGGWRRVTAAACLPAATAPVAAAQGQL